MKYNHELIDSMRTACSNPATVSENNRLYPLVASGDKAACEEMITSNMPLVIAIVESFLSLCHEFKYLRDDLTTAGFLGLVEAVRNLAAVRKTIANPTSYVSRSVRHHIYRAAKHSLHHACGKDMSRILLNTRHETPDSIDARDLIDSCCESSLDRQLVAMRESQYTFVEIARAVNMPRRTVIRMFHAIRDRSEAKLKTLRR